MNRLLPLIREMRAAAPGAFLAAAVLTALVPLAGMALMGLSGWFIAASAIAGLTGLGLTFDFLRPSAVIRLLTLGRSASRYGERLLGHDATLKALEVLRLRLWRQMAQLAPGRLARLHSAEGLNRLTADVDAAEGLLIRLVFPLVALVLAVLAGFASLALTIGPGLALTSLASQIVTATALFALSGRVHRRNARRQEAALQAIRSRSAETLSLRADLLVEGRLPAALARVEKAIARDEAARAALQSVDRRASAMILIGPAVAVSLILALGSALSAPLLLMALLVNLALGEALALFWRGWSERGRIELAARRLGQKPEPATVISADTEPLSGPVLSLSRLSIARPGGSRPLFEPLDLVLGAGESIAIAAPSGAGKSSLLAVIAGLATPLSGEAQLLGHPLSAWSEPDLRRHLTLVPQRPALIAGTIAENLRLAAPDATTEEMQDALEHVALWPALAPRGGLDLALGERGAGLSGGEARRLALARALLRHPALLLLDEPTTGLDAVTARRVLAGVRRALPGSAILIASHRPEELAPPQGAGQNVLAPMQLCRMHSVP